MDQNFQTSFIPKKPMMEERVATPTSVNPFTIISIFIFFAILLATGGLYFYKGALTQNITKMENDLSLAQNRFEPSKIEQLQVLDKRLNASNEILAGHIALSPIFKVLQDTTIKTIRYTKFSYSFDKKVKNAKILVKMSGQSVGYGSNSGYKGIALQSDILSKNKNIIDPIFSNLSLNEKGNVLFDLEFSVDPSFVDYKQMLQTEGGNPTSASSGAGVAS